MSEEPGATSPEVGHQGRAPRIALVFVVVWLVVQLAVPAVALFADRPERASWQMFSSLSDHPSYVLVYDDGSREEIRHSDVLPWVRADVDYAAHLPRHLCRERGGLQRVHVVPRGGEEAERTHHCRVEVHLSEEDG